MLEVIEIHKSFNTASGSLEVLKGVSFSADEGESISIVGPSGCGKSTLLNLIGGLDKADSGQITLSGQDLATFSEKQLAAFRNQRIGFVFQLHHLLPQCTVLENVLLPTMASGTLKEKTNELTKRAMNLLNLVDLRDKADELPGRLSGGQRQRAAVARALINEPEILLADEPTGSLDETTAMDVAKLLTDVNEKQKVTLIVVTHSGMLAGMMERQYQLHGGELILNS